jgi:carbon-monoxide dehydrogenase catalytic subunit
MVGCTTPKIAWEAGHVTIARELVRNGVLVLTSGCSSHALLNAGLCSFDAAEGAPAGLRNACEEAGVPPVLAIGSCADNTRIIQVFAQLANHAQEDLSDMPFAVSGPELANEKTMGQVMAMLAHGITAVVGLTPQLPIPADGSPGSEAVADFFSGAGLLELLGARLLVCPDPHGAASAILGVLNEKRVR